MREFVVVQNAFLGGPREHLLLHARQDSPHRENGQFYENFDDRVLVLDYLKYLKYLKKAVWIGLPIPQT